MLLRQLHRPLLRSVTAAWRPATTSRAPFHHGDSRSSNNSSSEHDQQGGTDNEASSAAPSKPKGSLFEKLFPDEAKRARAKANRASDTNVPKNTWVSQLFDEPPRLALPEEPQDEDVSAQEVPESYLPALRAQGMLILSAASKNLLESDFLRLGVKGKHVEGWVSGILKVIQARDPDTLEPKGHYFILFDTHEAAIVYKDRLEHLWHLSKTYVPGAHHHGRHLHTIQQPLPLPPGLRRTVHGEDVAALVRSFTLVAPSQRYHVQLSRTSGAKIAALDAEGGFVGQLAARAGSESLVLVRLDGGRMTRDTLRRAIEDDGLRRRLAWRVADLDNGILPFGKSILKASDQAPRDGARASQGSGNEAGDYHGGASGGGSGPADTPQAEESNEKYRQYPRFIIPFMDKAEAHRFVLYWHRRELRLRMGGGGNDQPSWQETRIINATVLW